MDPGRVAGSTGTAQFQVAANGAPSLRYQWHFNGLPRKNVARLNPDLSLDLAFDPAGGANESINAVMAPPDGSAVIGGDFTRIDGFSRR